jgi:hypothetical protein
MTPPRVHPLEPTLSLFKRRASLRIRTSHSSPDRRGSYRPQQCFERQVKTISQTRVCRVSAPLLVRWPRTCCACFDRAQIAWCFFSHRERAHWQMLCPPYSEYCAPQRMRACRQSPLWAARGVDRGARATPSAEVARGAARGAAEAGGQEAPSIRRALLGMVFLFLRCRA